MNCWVNYHSHTQFCDGASEPSAYIREAISQGLPAYGFSAHAPVSFPTDWCIPDNKFDEYLQQIEMLKTKYSNDIEIYNGLEIDFIPGIAGRNKHLPASTSLDYFIGSVHFVDVFEDGRHWNIDTSFELFEEGLEKIFNNNYRKAATQFYELTREMIELEKPDIIGHIDKIKMFNTRGAYFSEDEGWYKDQIALTIARLKKENSIVEINTRGFYRYSQPDLYPSEWIIQKLDAAGIPLMINSDSHAPGEITAGMEYAARKLKALGVKNLFALRKGKWQSYNFNENGLLFKN